MVCNGFITCYEIAKTNKFLIKHHPKVQGLRKIFLLRIIRILNAAAVSKIMISGL